MKIDQPYRWLLYVTLWAIWLTGIAWVVVHYFMREKGKFGFKTNPWEGWWLMAHGGVAVLTIFLFGWMWSRHVVTGWNLHWRRRSGGTLAGTAIFLTLSGYALYYIGDPDWLDWTAIAHWGVGIAALALFFIHFLSKSRPRRPAK
jgi:hypothetical protein